MGFNSAFKGLIGCQTLKCGCEIIAINKFNIHGPVHRNNILIYNSQPDAHVTEFILSDDCCTCLGYYYHPSSGAQNNCNYSTILTLSTTV
jgi:hypothetical protein